MKQIVKQIVKVGNSAGVLLPKEWLNGKAKVELIEKPLDLRKDILELLDTYLEEIVGVYLVGSYARGEETEKSDVDVIVITNKTEDKIKKGKYDILIISKEKLDELLKENALPLLPMLKEAKPIINAKLLENYKDIKMTKKNLKYHIETTKSALEVIRQDIISSKELNEKVSDASAYSLILRLRTLYIIECLKENRLWKKQEFLDLIKKTAGSLIAYERYITVKNNNRLGYKLPVEEVEKLMDEIKSRLGRVEKWLNEQKD